MSDEAQERVLGNLLARQAQLSGAKTERVEVPKTTVLPRVQVEEPQAGRHVAEPAEVVPMPKRRSVASWLLPLAAVLVLGLVVVRFALPTSKNSEEAKDLAPMAAEEVAAEATVAEEQTGAAAEESVDATAESEDLGIDVDAEEEAYDVAPTDELLPEPEEAQPMGTVDLYPIVVLDDNTVLTALIDGVYTQQLDVSQVSDSLGAAQAHPTDAEETVGCEVFKLADDAEGFAVRYDGEDTYWYCQQINME